VVVATPDVQPTAGTAIRITGVFTITGVGTVVAGDVEAGVVRPPMRFHVVAGRGSPTGPASVDVIKLEIHRKVVVEARTGDKAAFVLRGVPDTVQPKDVVRRGDLLMLAEPAE
jgi:translation elongation factor EF-Tu-like GTPase